MKFSNLLAGTATLVVLSLPATAQSIFDGAYVGAQIGLGSTSVDVDYDRGTTGNTSWSENDSETGLNGGIFFGYGQELYNKFWLGAELAYSKSNADDKGTISGIDYKIEQNETQELAIRPGYLIQPETLIYGRLGWVRTNFESSATDRTTSFSADDNFNGIRLGVGAEHALKDNFSIRLEASYTNYKDDSYTNSTTQEKVSYDLDEKLIRIGIAYRFQNNNYPIKNLSNLKAWEVFLFLL